MKTLHERKWETVNLKNMERQERKASLWMIDFEKKLLAHGYRPAGNGPLADTWVK